MALTLNLAHITINIGPAAAAATYDSSKFLADSIYCIVLCHRCNATPLSVTYTRALYSRNPIVGLRFYTV